MIKIQIKLFFMYVRNVKLIPIIVIMKLVLLKIIVIMKLVLLKIIVIKKLVKHYVVLKQTCFYVLELVCQRLSTYEPYRLTNILSTPHSKSS